jgi:hypothetical protein
MAYCQECKKETNGSAVALSEGLGSAIIKKKTMNVKELIKKLEQLPEEATIKTWDPYRDIETEEVYLSTDGKGTVWIMNATIGYNPL